jgi:predicted esterase
LCNFKQTSIYSSFTDPVKREENFHYIAQILQAEAQAVSLWKVFVGGLGQGCSMALHVRLLLGYAVESPCTALRLGGFIGMSGRLPFQSAVDNLLSSTSIEENTDGI